MLRKNQSIRNNAKMVMGLSVKDQVVATRIVAADGSGDYADIQKAIDSLPSTGGNVFIKEGTYLITATIDFPNNNITLQGTGKASQIKTNDNLTLIDIQKAGITIENLFLYGSGAGNNINGGINVGSSASRCTVTNCWIENIGSLGITVGGDECVVLNNKLLTISSSGIFISDSNESIVANNIINSANDGIDMLAASLTVVSGNYVTGSGANGIHLQGNAGVGWTTICIVTGNIIRSSGGTGLKIENDATNNIVTSNITDSVSLGSGSNTTANNRTV